MGKSTEFNYVFLKKVRVLPRVRFRFITSGRTLNVLNTFDVKKAIGSKFLTRNFSNNSSKLMSLQSIRKATLKSLKTKNHFYKRPLSQNCSKQAGTGPSRRHIQYPRLKNSKRTSKFQSILFYSTKLILKKVSQRQKKLKGGTLWDFSIPSLSQNPKKIERGALWGIFFEKMSCNVKKTERGDPLVSSGIVCYEGNFLVLFPGPTGEI